MGGEAGSAAALGSEGRVKSLGLVFEDERKGCYSSGETVAGHVLLDVAELVAVRALRLEAHGRATAAWGPSAGAAAPGPAAEVEYLNVRLSLREPRAGERRADPGRGWEGARRPMPTCQVCGAGLPGVGSPPPRGPSCLGRQCRAGNNASTPICQHRGDRVRRVHTLPGARHQASETFQDSAGSDPLSWKPEMSGQESSA